MQTHYYLYNKNHAPEALLARHPNHAKYDNGKVFLFCESLEEVTGTPAENIDDIAKHGLKGNSDAKGKGMKEDDFDDLVDQMLLRTPTGAEVKMSAAQGKHLYKTKFKPKDTGEGNPK